MAITKDILLSDKGLPAASQLDMQPRIIFNTSVVFLPENSTRLVLTLAGSYAAHAAALYSSIALGFT